VQELYLHAKARADAWATDHLIRVLCKNFLNIAKFFGNCAALTMFIKIDALFVGYQKTLQHKLYSN